MKFKTYKGLFDWDHFECLTKQPILANANTTQISRNRKGAPK